MISLGFLLTLKLNIDYEVVIISSGYCQFSSCFHSSAQKSTKKFSTTVLAGTEVLTGVNFIYVFSCRYPDRFIFSATKLCILRSLQNFFWRCLISHFKAFFFDLSGFIHPPSSFSPCLIVPIFWLVLGKAKLSALVYPMNISSILPFFKLSCLLDLLYFCQKFETSGYYM